MKIPLPSADRHDEALLIRIPIKLKKRGGRKELIVREGLSGTRLSKSPTQKPLITALARALHCQALLDGGKYASIADLSEALGLDRSYVSRITRLALLAPDIVEAIVQGREPSGLSLERLVKGMPMAWEKQRVGLEFPAE